MSHDSALNLAGHILSFRRYAVEFIDEDDGGSIGCCLVKDFSELLLTLAVVLGDDFWAIDRSEVSICLGGHGLCNQGLSCTRWSMQQDASRWINSQASEQDRVLEREFYHLPDLLELFSDTPDVLIGNRLDLTGLFLVDCLLFDYNLSIRQNLDYSLRAGGYNCERKSLCEQRHTGDENAVSCDYRTFIQTASREAFDSGSEPDLLLFGHDRAENESLTRLGLDL